MCRVFIVNNNGTVLMDEFAMPRRPVTNQSNDFLIEVDYTNIAMCRVCIVNNHGTVLMDEYAKPRQPVTNFRTEVSGIRPSDICNAPPFQEVKQRAARLLNGRTIVGHNVQKDLKVIHTVNGRTIQWMHDQVNNRMIQSIVVQLIQ